MLIWTPLLFAVWLGSAGAAAPAAVLPGPPPNTVLPVLPPADIPLAAPPGTFLPAPPPAAVDANAPANDAWFAEDKLRHFFLSFAATSLAYGAVRTAGLDHGPAEIVAGLSAAAAGVWKEIDDRRRGRPFSFRDLAWDGLGLAAALILAAQTR